MKETNGIAVNAAIREDFVKRGYTYPKAAHILNSSAQAVSNQLNSGRLLGHNLAMKYAQAFGYSYSYLRTGDGFLYNEGMRPEPVKVPRHEDTAPIEQRSKTIPLVPISARAGSLAECFEESLECERVITPVRNADLAMHITGDSMAPEYPNGSVVILKRINEKMFIEWGKVYVLDTENGAIVKEIHPAVNEGCVKCVSLNPDPRYVPYEVRKEDIRGWYRVLMVLSQNRVVLHSITLPKQ